MFVWFFLEFIVFPAVVVRRDNMFYVDTKKFLLLLKYIMCIAAPTLTFYEKIQIFVYSPEVSLYVLQ